MSSDDGRRPALSAGFAETLRRNAIVASTVVLFLVLSLGSAQFLTWVNLTNTLEAGAIYGIVAVGLTVLLIAGEFDLCAGAAVVLAGIIAARLQPALGAWPSLMLGVAVSVAIGLFNGVTVAIFRLNSFVATLASSLMVVGFGTIVPNGFQLYVPDRSFAVLGNGTLLGIAFFVWLFLGFALVAGFVLSQTAFGRWAYATGDDRNAARLAGIDIRAVQIRAFAFSGLAAGVAGAVLVSRTGTAIAGDGLGDILFPAIAAVVIGGTSILGGRGAIWRTVLGVLFLEMIRNGFNLLEINAYYQNIIRGGIILVAVTVDALSSRPSS